MLLQPLKILTLQTTHLHFMEQFTTNLLLLMKRPQYKSISIY